MVAIGLNEDGSTYSVFITVELPDNMEKQLRNLAAKQNRDIGVVVEEAVRLYLAAGVPRLRVEASALSGRPSKMATQRMKGRGASSRGFRPSGPGADGKPETTFARACSPHRSAGCPPPDLGQDQLIDFRNRDEAIRPISKEGLRKGTADVDCGVQHSEALIRVIEPLFPSPTEVDRFASALVASNPGLPERHQR